MESKFKLAKVLIKQAGAFIREQMGSDLMITQKSSHHDLVTHLDEQVQELLITGILSVYPEDGILAEENNVTHVMTEGHVWVIDPIDGTINFIAQKDDFAIMIAYFEDGVGQFGLIYDVMADHLYSGGPLFPATCNDLLLPHYKAKPLEQQLLISNATMYAHDEYGLSALIDASLGCRTYGSAGISMARVLTGKAMGYFSYIYPWDYAAAMIIGQTLGYTLLTLDGQEPDYRSREKMMFIPESEYALFRKRLRK